MSPILPLGHGERSIHRKVFSGSVNLGIIRNGADGISDMPWIPTGERSGLQTRIAMTESVSLCMRMKS